MSYIGVRPRRSMLPAKASATPRSGPGRFVLDEWVRGDHATFTKSPTYFDAENVKLDELIVRPVSDEDQKANAFHHRRRPARLDRPELHDRRR